MRIFRDLKEAAREIERDLFEMGIVSKSLTHQNRIVGESEDFESKELTSYSYAVEMLLDGIVDKLKAPETLTYMGKDSEESLHYVITEFEDRLNQDRPNPGSSCELNPELWDELRNADGTFDYTYSERFHDLQQLDAVIYELVRNRESRRATLSVYNPSMDTPLRFETGRIPCSMYYQFLIRKIDGEWTISCIYNMRSCDFYEHWVHDVLLAMLLTRYVKNQIDPNIKMGMLFHQIGSFHMFKKDYGTRNIF